MNDAEPAQLRDAADHLRRPYADPDAMPDAVFHYCSLAAAIHILQDRNVQASNVAHSNDPTEVAYGQRILQSVVKLEFPIFLFRDIFRFVADIDFYAACFSANGDLLPQWRAYCSNGKGVSLGVRTHVLAHHKEMLFVRMEYDEERQRQLVRDTIALYKVAFFAAAYDREQLSLLAREIALQFVVLKGMFKSPAYESEQEYRLFNTLPRAVSAHQTTLKFRAAGVSGSVLLPYYETSLINSSSHAATSPFARVVLGPCMPLRTSRAGLKLLLESAGLCDVKLCRSNVRMNCS